uniref:Protein kinase domain-containing protein n=1 Tax=Echeneis naucrates TaxID=173247 RepID=A0A665TR62_ECHNA
KSYNVLLDLLKKRQWKPLNLNELRPVTHQLLVAFETLKSIGIMHTDLKPDNVMLVNHKDQPFKIKLIDFGLATHSSRMEVGLMMQTAAYRAPEVNLGLPLSESVDMWSVGCVLAFLYFGGDLFPYRCEYHWMKTMVQMVGQPANHHILDGMWTWAFFIQDGSTGLRLRTPQEFEEVTGDKPEIYKRPFDSARNLRHAVMNYTPTSDHVEYEDWRTFLDLLRSCLCPDYDLRITPEEAVKHTFVTMDHLKTAASSYTDTAIQLMTVCPQEKSNKSPRPSVVSSCPDGARDTAAPSKEQPDSSALHNNIQTTAMCQFPVTMQAHQPTLHQPLEQQLSSKLTLMPSRQNVVTTMHFTSSSADDPAQLPNSPPTYQLLPHPHSNHQLQIHQDSSCYTSTYIYKDYSTAK